LIKDITQYIKITILEKTIMARQILANTAIHPGIHHKLGKGYGKGADHEGIIENIKSATQNSPVLVLGMRQNPVCKTVQKNLKKANVDYQYLEYGSYFSEWQPRLAIKMWTGWPTFPMVFVNGLLVGGNHEVSGLINSGELAKLLSKNESHESKAVTQ